MTANRLDISILISKKELQKCKKIMKKLIALWGRSLTVIIAVGFMVMATSCEKEEICDYKLLPATNCSVANKKIVFETTLEVTGECGNEIGFALTFVDHNIIQYIEKWHVQGEVFTWEVGELHGMKQTETISLILILDSAIPASLDVDVELEVIDGHGKQLTGRRFYCNNTATCSVTLGDAKPTATATTFEALIPLSEFGSCPVSFLVTSTDFAINDWIVQSSQTGTTWQTGVSASIGGTTQVTLKGTGTITPGTFVVEVFDASGSYAKKLYTIGQLGSNNPTCTAILGAMNGGVNANGGTFSIPITWTGTCPIGFALTAANFNVTSWSVTNGSQTWTAGQIKQINGSSFLTLTISGNIPANQSVDVTLSLLDANGNAISYAFGSFIYSSQTCQIDPNPVSYTKVTSSSGIARFKIDFTGGCINPTIKLFVLSPKITFSTIKIVGEGPLNNQILLQNASLAVPINGSGTLYLRVEFSASHVLNSGDEIFLHVEFNGTKIPAVVTVP